MRKDAGRDARAALELILALYQSAAKGGRKVRLPLKSKLTISQK